MPRRCIIVGGGHAGAQAVTSLRNGGWDEEIVLISNEPSLPYQRPPLSKTYLGGELSATELMIRPPTYYDTNQIEVRLSTVATAINRQRRTITLDSGEEVSYSFLILATGARARTIPNLPQPLHYLRSKSHIDNIIAALPDNGRVAMIGGGYIGLEAAASLRKRRLAVTVIEAADRILKRVTAPAMSDFFRLLHRHNGVEIVENTAITKLTQGQGGSCMITIRDGTELHVDAAIAGVGIVVNDSLAVGCGLEASDGITVDAHCRTTDGNIFAIGDCARQYNPLYGRWVRLESVPNAVHQAKVAAAAITTNDKQPVVALPWFWSDQYDVKLQIAGLSQHYDECAVRGSVSDRKFCLHYYRAGSPIAVDAVNSPREFMLAKKRLSETK